MVFYFLKTLCSKKEILLMIYLMMIDSEEDRSKFEILYKKYRKLMFVEAKGLLKDNYLAEDAVHNSFIKIAKNISDIGETEAKETKNFIMVITRNVSLDMYRKRARSLNQEISVEENEEADIFITNEEKDLSDVVSEESPLLKIIRNLPAKYRDVFLLKYIKEYDNKKIAKILNVSEEVVRQRISRGRNIIEKKMEGIQ